MTVVIMLYVIGALFTLGLLLAHQEGFSSDTSVNVSTAIAICVAACVLWPITLGLTLGELIQVLEKHLMRASIKTCWDKSDTSDDVQV